LVGEVTSQGKKKRKTRKAGSQGGAVSLGKWGMTYGKVNSYRGGAHAEGLIREVQSGRVLSLKKKRGITA